MPYKGICEHTRKMKRVIMVHIIFSLKAILCSGVLTSGRTHMIGFTRLRNRIFVVCAGKERGISFS
jgi:hypothetical protein